MTTAPAPKRRAQIRRALAWLAGAAILVAVISRMPMADFADAIAHGPYGWLAVIDLVLAAVTLFTDAFATWVGLIGLRMRRPWRDVLVVRGATYLLLLLNYALGQGGFGYYLHRTGVTPLRAVGATLFLMGTNLACLLLVTGAAWLIHPIATPNPTMWWTLVIGCGGFALYLGVIALAPNFIARRDTFAPLFDAGLRGHAFAVVGRVPHIIAGVLGIWIGMRVWGIPVPLGFGIVIIPATIIASVIPISPFGLGTVQAAFVYFFAPYATGPQILAYSIVHLVYGLVSSLVVGFACAPFAKRAVPAAATAA